METIVDLNTYLFFDGQCEDAFRLYEKVLGGKITTLMRYSDAPSGPAAFKGCNRVIHVSLRFGMLNDRFGTPWMITCPKPMLAAAGETKPFVISRTFDVPRDTLWKCLTDPERMRQWWGPKGVTIIASKMDLRPGGTYHYGMRTGDGKEMWGKFVYREITPPERLVFVSAFSDETGGLTRHPLAPSWPIEMLSMFSLVEAGGKTTFTVTWSPLNPTPEERATFDSGHDSMKQGWTGTMEQLAAYLGKL
jgi:uncharacterized protein YndB with AHSA1/START domain